MSGVNIKAQATCIYLQGLEPSQFTINFRSNSNNFTTFLQSPRGFPLCTCQCEVSRCWGMCRTCADPSPDSAPPVLRGLGFAPLFWAVGCYEYPLVCVALLRVADWSSECSECSAQSAPECAHNRVLLSARQLQLSIEHNRKWTLNGVSGGQGRKVLYKSQVVKSEIMETYATSCIAK